ncbi:MULTISPECIES: hypothetical protein [unclassified Wolbachia]|uniref:hypothetical protein n=1 Tax=unclassified Wolbachia TaxID=2640676 RepID=UPI0022209851|nr:MULTISPECIES: hypothetical protein [unclassified Wolbachia]MDX5496258.1 hypothetical protein [Wolbachia endosymbiont of Nomada fabriciana]MDX5507186.1 hypothetical protein [Wolbachia endosymbiont of Hylaeus sinuatus]MDX5527870.1 hypothetical protein [Wolbachia endosymbiont of Andrena minutula]
MHSPFKKPKSKEGDINQQLSNTIYKKVTAENYQENQDETSKECKRLFKQGASPKTLAELEKILRERQNEQAIAKHLESSKQGTSPEALAELEKSVGKKREHYNNYIQHFLPALKAEITESKKLDSKKKAAIVKTILDITNRSSSVSSIPNAVEENIEDQMQLKHIEEQNNTQETPLNVAEKKSGDNKILSNSEVAEEVFEKYSKVVKEIEEKQTSKLSSGNDSDSGIDSPGLSEKNSISPINSRKNSLTSIASTSSEESLNSTLSSVEGDNGLQPEGGEKTELLESNLESPKENETQVQPEQTVKKEPKMQENENSDGQANPDQVKKDILLKNQPNNRNLHVALVAGCALSTIGCIVAGAMTSGLIGAGLLAMVAVLAIAAVAELHSNFLSSKLTSINVSPLVDDKELTACSRL